MAKPELGRKRLCANCSTKFFDLLHDPIVCPKCGAVFEVPAVTRNGRVDGPSTVKKQSGVEPGVLADDLEVVSLEEVEPEEKDETGTEIEDDSDQVPTDDTLIEEEEDDHGVVDLVDLEDNDDT